MATEATEVGQQVRKPAGERGENIANAPDWLASLSWQLILFLTRPPRDPCPACSKESVRN
jgi:hypothetical protein